MKLTNRRREIITYMAHGKTTRQIASEMGLADGTIRRYRQIMYEQMGLTGVDHPGVRLVTWFVKLLKGDER